MLNLIVAPLKMGPTGCPETSVINYHYSLRNDPEERSSRSVCNFQFYPKIMESEYEVL